MSITTLAQISAIPIGMGVQISNDANQVWEHIRDNVWTKDGIQVNDSALVPAANAGQLAQFDTRCRVGDLFESGQYQYLIVRMDGSAVHYLSLHRGNYSSLSEDQAGTFVTMSKVHPVPAHMGILQTLAENVLNANSGRPLVQAGLVSDLHAWAKGLKNPGKFDALLDRNGITRMADHHCLVTYSGKALVEVPIQSLAAELGAGYEVDGEAYRTEVGFKNTVTVTKSGLGCQCSTVTLDDLTSSIPSNVTGEVTFTVTCPDAKQKAEKVAIPDFAA